MPTRAERIPSPMKTQKGITPVRRMERVEIRRSFTNPVDQSTSWTATMDSTEIMMGRKMGGSRKKITKISGMHTTATRIRFPMAHTPPNRRERP